MNILQITPVGKHRRSGNHVTAQRYSRLLRELGHRVVTDSVYDGRQADMLIALHAAHGRDTVLNFSKTNPGRPVVVVLTGTDIHHYIQEAPAGIEEVLHMADALVCFHGRVEKNLPAAVRSRCHVIFQSARPLAGPRRPAKRHFDICVIGHLRAVKDPLCAARAVRDLPAHSGMRIKQLGKVLDEDFRQQVMDEMRDNQRYRWLGDVPHWRVRQELARTRLMVISSLAEGGANVISEAVMAGVPVVATAIDGNIGLLGDDYRGYYPAGDASALQQLLIKLESSPDELNRLQQQCTDRRHLFTHAHELQSWRDLMTRVGM